MDNLNLQERLVATCVKVFLDNALGDLEAHTRTLASYQNVLRTLPERITWERLNIPMTTYRAFMVACMSNIPVMRAPTHVYVPPPEQFATMLARSIVEYDTVQSRQWLLTDDRARTQKAIDMIYMTIARIPPPQTPPPRGAEVASHRSVDMREGSVHGGHAHETTFVESASQFVRNVDAEELALKNAMRYAQRAERTQRAESTADPAAEPTAAEPTDPAGTAEPAAAASGRPTTRLVTICPPASVAGAH